MNSDWTEQEIKVITTEGLSLGEMAKKIGRTVDSIKTKRYTLRHNGGARAKQAARVEVNFDKNREEQSEAYWKNQYVKLDREYSKCLKQLAVVDRLVAAITSIAPVSYSAAPKVLMPPRKKSATPESAVLLFSDTHIGKVTRPEQTLGFSRYDFPTFLARLKFLETTTISILRDHTTAPLNELMVAMLGDMLDGALSHCVEAGQVNVLFNQFYQAAHAIAQFFRNIAAHVPLIRIETTVGNHTRWQNQKKMPSTNRYSNMDMFLYAMIEALTKDIPNIRWNLTEQPYAVFEVEKFVFMAAHGDHWKGGDKAMGIPLHSIGRQINSTTQLFYKNGVPVPHYYVSGHFHREIQLPHGLGDITINGGFPGLDNYALDGNFNPVDPTQVFFRVHPKYGKIAQYNIQLKHANLDVPTYQLPNRFLCT